MEITASSTVCSRIKTRTIKNPLDYEIALASHDWKLEKVEEHGREGVLVLMKCKRCGSDRVSVMSPKVPHFTS